MRKSLENAPHQERYPLDFTSLLILVQIEPAIVSIQYSCVEGFETDLLYIISEVDFLLR